MTTRDEAEMITRPRDDETTCDCSGTPNRGLRRRSVLQGIAAGLGLAAVSSAVESSS
jgi:hypothetical protein